MTTLRGGMSLLKLNLASVMLCADSNLEVAQLARRRSRRGQLMVAGVLMFCG